MTPLTLRSFSEDLWEVTPQNLEEHLNRLPQRIQEVFREKIRDLNLVVTKYYFAKRVEEEPFHELGRKEIKTFYILALGLPPRGLFPDMNSPLHTKVLHETLIEEIPRVVPAPTLVSVEERSLCSCLQQLISKILELIRQVFAPCYPSSPA